ncbi:MAG: TldD family protein, Actinobacterial subgroup [Cytophagales bacterium]|jgi:TldD protein|nr:TldD/PmbA family protein [Bacteroidota bacterium]MBS1981415.1 TldD/PmbA family protein [Bacteroidota bacterium]WHZ06770.1 MAG: TldD family protein, Actinobacterial subgroup [Cytophagales bacterium]
MKRRDFVQLTGAGIAGSILSFPTFGNPVSVDKLVEPFLSVAAKKQLADVALNTAKLLGATYTDVRIGRYLNQFISTRENKVQNIVNTESFGVGIRVIANGTWGFAATNAVTNEGVKMATEQAVRIAKANSKYQKEPVVLAPNEGHGEVSWNTPLQKNSLEVPVAEKVDLLLRANSEALKNGASFANSNLFQVNEQKYFASTDGSYIDQDIHRIWPTFTVSVTDRASGKFKSRAAMSAPMGMGYEYMIPKPEDKLPGPSGMVLYRNSYDIIEDAAIAARQAKEMISAKSVEPGKYDLVLEPNHLGLTIHESVGHPLELDRILGYEANYAGTSFATLDKLKSGTFNYGSKQVNIFADKTQAGSLGAVGYDDEGVKAKRWDLIKAGIFVNVEAIRDQVHIVGQKESHGCCYAQSWSDVQFQRMPNVSLAPGQEPYSSAQMIKDVEKGIYIAGRGSYSIDQQRYNFQFGGTAFYEIKNGEITGMLNDVAYQSNTQEFWNSCAKICDEKDYRLFGSFFDGKGQPSQISAVSHGSSTSRFNGVNVINTGRTI